MRAAAQSISYEIALGLTVVGMLIVAGSTELSQIVNEQAGTTFYGLLPRWGVFLNPLGAMLFFIAAIAETKRVPFDLPEGESEIIGYFVEYSSMGFGLFMLGEFVEIVVLGCLFTTLFLGGWQMPGLLGDHVLNLGFTSIELVPWAYGLLGMLFFGIKVFLLCSLQLQIRWTLPRFRYDQLMHLGWKTLLPLALLNIFLHGITGMVGSNVGALGGFRCAQHRVVHHGGHRRTQTANCYGSGTLRGQTKPWQLSKYEIKSIFRPTSAAICQKFFVAC